MVQQLSYLDNASAAPGPHAHCRGQRRRGRIAPQNRLV